MLLLFSLHPKTKSQTESLKDLVRVPLSDWTVVHTATQRAVWAFLMNMELAFMKHKCARHSTTSHTVFHLM